MAADLSLDGTLSAEWGEDCLVTFNIPQIKLVTFHRHQADSKHSPVMMDDSFLEETASLEQQLQLHAECKTNH